MTFRFGRLAGLGLGLVALAANIAAATYTTGDVFASKSGSVREYSPTGTFVQSLTSGISGFTTGAAFDSSGNYYVTDFSSGAVLKFADNATNTQTTFASGFATPEDILVDGSGKVFISDLGGHGLGLYNSAGTLTQSWATGHRIDWFDLNSSESTMYYTDESGTIHRWDLTTNTALTDLCASCGVFALRLLGDGSLLVADATGGVNQVDATTGAILHNYTAASLGGGDFFALNLDPDGTTFWTGEFSGDNIHRVNIATGAVITSFNSGSSGSSLYGLSVFGEKTVTSQIPEPASILMLGTVLSLVGFGLKRKLRAS